jgi:hypothetical protein
LHWHSLLSQLARRRKSGSGIYRRSIAELLALVSASSSEISINQTPLTSIAESFDPTLERRSVNQGLANCRRPEDF